MISLYNYTICTIYYIYIYKCEKYKHDCVLINFSYYPSKKNNLWNHQAAMLLAAPLFQTTFVGKASAITVLMAKSRESIIPFQGTTVSNALTKGLEKSLSHWWAKHWVFCGLSNPPWATYSSCFEGSKLTLNSLKPDHGWCLRFAVALSEKLFAA